MNSKLVARSLLSVAMRIGITSIILSTLVSPLFASAQTETTQTDTTATTETTTPPAASATFSKEGIFGCNRNVASLPQSVGAFSATGGVYVPVADYTVELNTGILVYQQCILRGIVNRMSESAVTALNKNVLNTVLTGGDNGRKLYRSEPDAEDLAESDRVWLKGLEKLQATPDALSRAAPVTSVVAKGYMASRQPQNQIACPYQGNLTNVWNGTDTSQAAREALADTRCNPLFGYVYRKNYLDTQAARAINEKILQVQAGGGFYAKTTVDANGNRIIETPSSLIADSAQQAVNSGYQRTLNANDVDQMVGALFAGLSTQVVSGSKGLAGINQRIGSQPSYLDQVTAESSASLRSAAGNAALQVLAGARQIEQRYNAAVTAIANTLTNTIGQLRSAERQCWNLIIQKTCTNTPTGNTCTSPSGSTLRIATSTAFSQPIITASIAPLANQTVANIQTSQNALTLIDQLIVSVTNTTSLDAQRLAVLQVDQLVAQKRLHQQSDVTNVQQQQSAITDTMSTLVQDTVQTWGDSSDPNIGWCNVNNQAVVDLWISRWRQ